MEQFFINKQEKRLRAFWRISIQIFMIFLMFILFSEVFSNITSFLNWYDIIMDNYIYRKIYYSIIMFLAIILSIIITSKYIDKRDISEFGVKTNYAWIFEFICGSLIGAFIISLILIIDLKINSISEIQVLSLNSKVIFILLNYIFVSVYEELLFRGYLLLNLSEGLYFKRYINKKLSIILAVILSSIIFSLIHWNIYTSGLAINLFNNFIFGVLLSLSFIYTKKMAIPIGFHLAFNFFIYLDVKYLEYNFGNKYSKHLFGIRTYDLLTLFGLIIAGVLIYFLIKKRYTKLKLEINYNNKANK